MYKKPIQTIVVFSFFIFSFSLRAQLPARVPALQWDYAVGGSSHDVIIDSELDKAGNIINVGVYQDTVDFIQGPGVDQRIATSGIYAGFIQKLDEQGNQVWLHTFSDYDDCVVSHVTVDHSNNIIVTGTFDVDSLDMDPSQNQTYYLQKGNYAKASFLLKLDASGNFIWAIAQGGNELNYNDVKTDLSGNIYALAYFKSSFDNNPNQSISSTTNPMTIGKKDLFIQKISSTGQQEWYRTVRATDNVEGNALALNSAYDVIIAGYFINGVDFDPGPGYVYLNPTRIENKGFVLTLDSVGIFQSVLRTEGAGTAMFSDIILDGDDNIYLAGNYGGKTDFDPGVGVSSSRATVSEGHFVEKLSSNGVFEWVHPYETYQDATENQALRLAIDKQKNVHVAGYFRQGSINLEPLVTNGAILQNNSFSADGFIVKHDSTGALTWAYGFGSNQWDRILALMVDSIGNTYVSGYFNGTISFDPYNSNITRPCQGPGDIFQLKFGSCPPVKDSTIVTEDCNRYIDKWGYVHKKDTTFIDTAYVENTCDSTVVTRIVNIDGLPANVKVTGLRRMEWDFPNPVLGDYWFTWIDCSNDSVLINRSYSAYTFHSSYDGYFTLALTDIDTKCTDTSACVYVNAISVPENSLSKLQVYPNPTTGLLYFENANREGEPEVQLMDIRGRVLIKQKIQSELDISHLPKGTYLVQVKQGSWTTVKRLVKE